MFINIDYKVCVRTINWINNRRICIVKNKLITFLLIGAFAVSLVACGSEDKASTPEASETAEASEKPEVKTQKSNNKKTSIEEKVDTNFEDEEVDDSNSADDFIVLKNLGDGNYKATVADEIILAELWFCEMDNDMNYVVTDFCSDFDTSVDKTFTFCDNNPGDYADMLALLYYEGGAKCFTFEVSGVDGSIYPMENSFIDSDNGSIGEDISEDQQDSGSGISLEDYLGVWGSDRISINVIGTKSGNLQFTITWPESAAVEYEWNYYCAFDPATGKMVCDGMSDKSINTYVEDGSFTMDPVYDNGSGEFFIKNGRLYWSDFIEDAGAGLEFVH